MQTGNVTTRKLPLIQRNTWLVISSLRLSYSLKALYYSSYASHKSFSSAIHQGLIRRISATESLHLPINPSDVFVMLCRRMVNISSLLTIQRRFFEKGGCIIRVEEVQVIQNWEISIILLTPSIFNVTHKTAEYENHFRMFRLQKWRTDQ